MIQDGLVVVDMVLSGLFDGAGGQTVNGASALNQAYHR